MELQDKINKISAILTTHSHRLANLETAVNSAANAQDFNSCRLSIETYVKTGQQEIAALQSAVLKYDNIFNLFEEHKRMCDQKLKDLQAQIAENKANCDVFHKANEEFRKSIMAHMQNMVETLGKALEQKIRESLPLINEDLVAEKTKEKIKKEVDAIVIDASNASLKYNNLAYDVSIINKKIENIYLLIKRLENNKV